MAKGNVQHDVLQLLDKYSANEILDTMVTLGAGDGVKKWAEKYFEIKPDAGDDLDKHLIRGILAEIETLKQKVARLEFQKIEGSGTGTYFEPVR